MSTITVVVGIIKVKQRLLICQRPEGKPYAGYWEFPGGKIEAGESAYEALTRELKEELDIQVTSALPLWEHAHVYPDKEVLLKLWQVDAYDGDPVGKEGQTLCWVTIDMLANKKILAGNFAIIEKIKTMDF